MKKKILLVFSLLFIVYSLLFIISPVLAGLEECKMACDTSVDKCGEAGRFMKAVSDQCRCCGCCELNDFLRLAKGFSRHLVGIVGVLALIFFIVGGIMWMLSGGNQEMVKRGKRILINSLIGIIIVLFAWQIVNSVICAMSKGEISETCGLIFVDRKWFVFPE